MPRDKGPDREADTPTELHAATRPTDPAPPPTNEVEAMLAILARLETIDANVRLLLEDARAQRLDFGARIARLERWVEERTT